MDNKEFLDWNEEMFVKYNNERLYLHPNPIVRWIENKRLKTIQNFIKLNNDQKFLSIGCGEAYIESRINEGSLYLMDISNEAIKRAKEKLADKKNVVEIKTGDGLNIDYPDNFFDYILCSEVIEHVLDYDKLISEIARVAKNDAKIIVTIPNEKKIDFIKNILIKTKLFSLFFKNIPVTQEWHLHAFDLVLLKKAINNKLTLLQAKAIPLFFLPLRYVCLLTKKNN